MSSGLFTKSNGRISGVFATLTEAGLSVRRATAVDVPQENTLLDPSCLENAANLAWLDTQLSTVHFKDGFVEEWVKLRVRKETEFRSILYLVAHHRKDLCGIVARQRVAELLLGRLQAIECTTCLEVVRKLLSGEVLSISHEVRNAHRFVFQAVIDVVHHRE